MTEKERIIQVFKDQIKLCGPDPERHRWWVTMTADDSRLIVSWLEQQKEGHWTVLEDCSNSGIYCSECHVKVFEFTSKPKKKLSNYCPHCGSRNEQFFRDGKVVFN